MPKWLEELDRKIGYGDPPPAPPREPVRKKSKKKTPGRKRVLWEGPKELYVITYTCPSCYTVKTETSAVYYQMYCARCKCNFVIEREKAE